MKFLKTISRILVSSLALVSMAKAVEQVDHGYTLLDALETGHRGCEEWCLLMQRNEGWSYSQCMIDTAAQGYCGSPPSTAKPSSNEENIPVPLPRPASVRCEQEYHAIVQRCEQATSAAQSPCDSSKNPQIGSVTSGASQMGAQNSNGVQDSCEQVKNLNTSAINALSSFKNTCSNAINSCKSACSEFSSFAQGSCFQENPTVAGLTASQMAAKATQGAQRCMSHQYKVDQAQSAIARYEQNRNNSEQCAEQTAGDEERKEKDKDVAGESDSGLGQLANLASALGNGAPPTPAPPPTFCEQNPAAPGCSSATQVNCLDPAQATSNKVCICAANPLHPSCSSANSQEGQVGLGGDLIDSSSRMPTANEDSGSYDAGGLPPLGQAARGSSDGSGGVVDGRQGSSNPVGQSTVGDGRKDFKAAQVHTFNDSSGSTTVGGGGGRSFTGSVTQTGTGSHRYIPRPQDQSSQVQNPDLRKFLPGGVKDPRGGGITGASGPDGITGPHSNIWQKIQNRYNVLSPTLMP